jgi:hypothetical protein
MDIPEIIDEPADRLGMTDDQWEWFQKATHGYGEQDENGIDLSLLRANLRLTPTERLEQHRQSLNLIQEIGRAGRNTRLQQNLTGS